MNTSPTSQEQLASPVDRHGRKHVELGAASSLVHQLMTEAFGAPRAPRSAAYKLGAYELLNYRVYGVKLARPYLMGTAEADAFYAGVEEGNAIWQRHQAAVAGAANSDPQVPQ